MTHFSFVCRDRDARGRERIGNGISRRPLIEAKLHESVWWRRDSMTLRVRSRRRLSDACAVFVAERSVENALGRCRALSDARRILLHPAARASELVRGEIRAMTPASGAHGAVAAAIFRAIDRFVEDNHLGMCFADNTGFALPGIENTVRSPDAAFVRAERLPTAGIGAGWISVAPDLVVEIVSPNETRAEVEEKLRTIGLPERHWRG